jgi:hypothetical protein
MGQLEYVARTKEVRNIYIYKMMVRNSRKVTISTQWKNFRIKFVIFLRFWHNL